MPENLETKCKKAVLKIADVVEEMNLKLCHIIETFKDFRNSLYWTSPRGSYNQDYTKSGYYNENENAY